MITNPTPIQALKYAIFLVGSQSALARKLGITQQSVWTWINKTRQIPAQHVLTVEKLTDNQVTRSQLRPDLYPK